MIKSLSLASAAAVLLSSAALAADTPAAQKFLDGIAKVTQDANALTQAPAAFKTSFNSSLQRALKDAKCQPPLPNRTNCPTADADSLDAGNTDLQALQGLVADQKSAAAAGAEAQAALMTAKLQFGQLASKVLLAIPQVKDALARGTYGQQLSQALTKDGCTLSSNVYICVSSTLSLDKLSAETDNLNTLLAAVNGDNASNPRPAELKNFTQGANQVLAAVVKMQSAQDQATYRQQLDQRIGMGSSADGCRSSSGAYDCSSSLLKMADIDKEIAWLQTLLATVNAVNADPRPALLKQFTQTAAQTQAFVAVVINPNVKTPLGQKLTQTMTMDGCRLVSGAYDCSSSSVVTGKINTEIAALQSIIDAARNSNAADPAVVMRGQLQLAGNNAVGALSSVQDPTAQNSFKRLISDTLTKAGCTGNGTYWDCTKATYPGNMGSDTEYLQKLPVQMAAANVVDPSIVKPLVSAFSNLANIIAGIPNKDDVTALTAKLTAVIAEGGCQTKSGGYDCSKTTYNQFQAATADAAALLTVVTQTSRADGPLADHVKAAAAAASLQNSGRELSPQSARDTFTTSWLAALNKAKCVTTVDPIDCTKATEAQLAQLTQDLATLQNQTQSLLVKQAAVAAALINNTAAQQQTTQILGILQSTDQSIAAASITDTLKQTLYAKVMAMRDQLEAGKLVVAGQAAGSSSPNAGIVAGQIAGGAIAAVAGSAASGSSGSFGGGVPPAVVQALALQTQIKAQIASAGAH